MGPGRFPLARFARKRRRDDEMGRRAIRRHLLVQHVDRSDTYQPESALELFPLDMDQPSSGG
jgi:hypothetical protein